MDPMGVSLNAGETTTTTTTTLVRKRERGSECSHKVIEKRRRDRINGCLHELSRLVPAARARQGSGKLEKAEILEMTVDYLKKIQLSQDEDCIQGLVELSGEKAPLSSKDQVSLKVKVLQSFRHGYNECMTEVQKFLCNDNGSGEEPGNIPCLLNHLQLRLNEETSKATISEKVNSPPSSTPSQTPLTHEVPSPKHVPQEPSTNNNHEEALQMKTESSSLETPNKKPHLAPAGCVSLPPTQVTASQDASRVTSNVAMPTIMPQNVTTLAPAVHTQQSQQLFHQPFVPAYALHPSGTHYIPIAIQPGAPITQIGVGNVGVIPTASMTPNVGMINAPFAVVSPGGMQFGAPNGVVHGALTSTVASSQQKSLLCSIAENDMTQSDCKQADIAGQLTLSESIATQTEISCKDDKTSPALVTQGQVELNMISVSQSF